MKKFLFKNIVSIVVSLLVLSSGSLASILHYSCISDGSEHIQCQMDECGDNDCCETPDNTDDASANNDCCVVHPEVFSEPELFILTVNNIKIKLSSEVNYSNITDPQLLKNISSDFYPLQIYCNYYSGNIYLINSSLRI
ncbi:MAG: hypothetical protein IPM38_12615 [Ignavibacteria bacterium]|nr:hypothetical protein [Ignavibacteria bacterium]